MFWRAPYFGARAELPCEILVRHDKRITKSIYLSEIILVTTAGHPAPAAFLIHVANQFAAIEYFSRKNYRLYQNEKGLVYCLNLCVLVFDSRILWCITVDFNSLFKLDRNVCETITVEKVIRVEIDSR